jgi:hypothetical protein
MAISTGMLASDLDAMIADLPAIITAWKGVALGANAVTGTMSEVGKENDVQDDGILKNFDAIWVGDINDFATVPAQQDSITINSVIYYIDRREDAQDGVGITFLLKRV